MSKVLSNTQAVCREKITVEELLDRSRWSDDEFKLLTSYLTYTDYDRQQALLAVPIENLLGNLGINFPTGKRTPQVCCFLPGHADNTASMTLYRRTNSCYCFGCRRRLNTIDVLVQLYGKSYSEAMDYLLGDCLQLPAQLLRRRIKARFEKLAHKREYQQKRPPLQLIKPSLLEKGKLPTLAPVAGVAHQESRRPENDPTVEIGGRQEEVEQILAAAANFYHFQLENCPQAYRYLIGRGLTEITIKEQKLGYASGVGLSSWLKNHHLDLELATKIGLVGPCGAERLIGRIILPIFDHEAKVAGLTGRYLCGQLESYRWLETDWSENSESEISDVVENMGEKNLPKYLHLRLPKPHLSQFLPATSTEPTDYLLLVEGPFDYLVARQWGYRVVCSFGTNLGSENVQFLKQLLTTERLGQLLICFDNDPDRLLPDGTRRLGAGPQATAELLATLDNLRAKVVGLPQNVKDIANLGELPEGKTLLAQAIKQVYSSD